MLCLVGGPAGAQGQADLNAKAGASYQAADRKLNAVYARLVAQASPGGRVRLRTAQRAWIAFRDADCDARAGSRGGSFYPTSRAACLEVLTEDRTRILAAELRCPEGDMGCGGHRYD